MSRRRHDHEDTIEFYSYRSDLGRLIEKLNHVIENTNDFWAFVQKYEEVERKKSKQHVQYERPPNSGYFRRIYRILFISYY